MAKREPIPLLGGGQNGASAPPTGPRGAMVLIMLRDEDEGEGVGVRVESFPTFAGGAETPAQALAVAMLEAVREAMGGGDGPPAATGT
jgi:hypothetical protein